MTAPRVPALNTDPEPDAAARGRSPRARKTLAGLLLSAAVAAALAAGGWGLLSAQIPQASAGEAVAQGESAEVPGGGLLRVEDVIPEHMAPMQMDKFAKTGMNMSGMGMDMTPKGQQRFTVQLSLAARDGGLTYSADDFRLIGEGVEEAAPIRSKLGDGALPSGSRTNGSLVFQAPEESDGLMLSFDGGEPVALDLGEKSAADDEDGGSQGGASSGSHGH